ncbi:MAG: efflux RND transporter periplasmic adaptor subunit, partial [Cytophagaceae bacterium]
MKTSSVTLLIGYVCLLAGCGTKPVQEEQKAFRLSDTMMQRIQVDSVQTQPVRSELTLVGKIMADESRVIKVFPLVGGDVEAVEV